MASYQPDSDKKFDTSHWQVKVFILHSPGELRFSEGHIFALESTRDRWQLYLATCRWASRCLSVDATDVEVLKNRSTLLKMHTFRTHSFSHYREWLRYDRASNFYGDWSIFDRWETIRYRAEATQFNRNNRLKNSMKFSARRVKGRKEEEEKSNSTSDSSAAMPFYHWEVTSDWSTRLLTVPLLTRSLSLRFRLTRTRSSWCNKIEQWRLSGLFHFQRER